MEPFDTDTFIAEIQAEPAIWDYKSDVYSNRIQKTKAWEKICGVFHENFQELSSKEKNDIAANLQRKWKSLRDSYNRELKSLKKLGTGKGASKKKKYIYFEQLSFLEPLAQQKETTSTLDDKGDGEDLSDIVDGTTAVEVLLPRKNNGTKKNKANKEDELIQILKEKISKKQTLEATNISQDEDTLFCLSLVTDFRKIVDDLKSDVKCEVLQVLNKYKRLSVSHYGHSSTLTQHNNFDYPQYSNLNPLQPSHTEIYTPVPRMTQTQQTNANFPLQYPTYTTTTQPHRHSSRQLQANGNFTSVLPSTSTLIQLQPPSSSQFPVTVSTPLVSPSYSSVSSPGSANHYPAGSQEETQDSVITDLF